MVAHEFLLFAEKLLVHLGNDSFVEIWVLAGGDGGCQVAPVLG